MLDHRATLRSQPSASPGRQADGVQPPDESPSPPIEQQPRARAWVGISGWRYKEWRGDFYPKGLVQRRELEFVGERMSTVELNGSFYSLQRPASYERWRDAVPDDFVFAVKGSRYITHMLRLRDVEVAMANFSLWDMPEEYVRIGRSMKSSSPVNSTMSSNFSSICGRVRPRASEPRTMLRAPERSGIRAAPTPRRFGLEFA